MLKELGLFSGGRRNTEAAIENLNQQVEEIRSELKILGERIKEVRDELEREIRQSEYRLIANSVIAGNETFLQFIRTGNRTLVASLALNSNTNERNLDAMLSSEEVRLSSQFYVAYFNLYLIHMRSRFVIQSCLDGVGTDEKVAFVARNADRIAAYGAACLNHLRRAIRDQYEIRYLGFDQDRILLDDNGRRMPGARAYELWGFSKGGGPEVVVSRAEFRSGLLDHVGPGNQSRRRAAKAAVHAHIEGLVEDEFEIESRPYGGILTMLPDSLAETVGR
ncbi:hypothetical protein SL003B_3306 [Polymorphum gilvum SL003B-26A1]|uniref:Uncharacterized protein n=1 Tax=Polymorphum gilvum (strain LMG 25793 / CGMCC 1.9160 / SL003B-26A1) TaxID=991905 RepID=F2IYB6_POLGS|nr:hypothetical protein SL003B_3306 [Polymorphum gilvum SL003B-26A1]